MQNHRVRRGCHAHAFVRRLVGLGREGFHGDRQAFEAQHGVADFFAIVEEVDCGGRDEDAEDRASGHFRSVAGS